MSLEIRKTADVDGEDTPNSAGPEFEPSPLDPPRFTIRALLLATALVGALLAMYQAIGGYAAVLIVILALAVVAHVAGNAIGTKLRDRSTQSRPAATEPPRQLQQGDYAPKTNLAARESLGWPLLIATAIGVLAGALAGALLFTHWEMEKATWEDTLLGALAFAMLGGMSTFVAAGFAQVMFRAWRQAEGRRDASE